MVSQTSGLRNKLIASQREDGFSLPEMMIALLVFGALVAIAVPVFLSQQNAVNSSSLQADLATASSIIENERQANNGVYPAYIPDEIANTQGWENFVYTYSDTQLVYCIQGTREGETLYVGSGTGGEITTESCEQANVGGPQPADSEGGTNIPPTNNNPSIIAITPAVQYHREAGELITITGTHFLTGAQVLFDGVLIPATVSNSGSLTFVNPGNDAYEAVTVQVKNPNARTSGVVTFEFINPILTHTAATPGIIQITNMVPLSVTITAPAITCPYNATPQYAFIMPQQNSNVNANGFPFVSSTGVDVTNWNVSRSFTWNALYQGWQYYVQVKARCELEGQYSIESSWSPTSSWAQPVQQPAAPPVAPTTTNEQPIINSSYTIGWAAYPSYCPAQTTAQYKLYQNNTVSQALTTSLSKAYTAPGASQTLNYHLTITCVGVARDSSESPASPIRAVNVIAKPNTPAKVTGLNPVTIGATSSTVEWNPVACNIGTAQYRIGREDPAPSGPVTVWNSATNGTIPHPGGEKIKWYVEARCTLNGVTSETSKSNDSVFNAGLLSPTGTLTATGSGTTVTASTVTCPAGTLQYQVIKTLDGNSTTTVTYGWTTSNTTTISGNQGTRFQAKVQARCYTSNSTSDVVESPVSSAWVNPIATPSRPASMSRSGNRISWSAVSCPAGTSVRYYAWITRQNNNGTTANSGETGSTTWTRPSLTVGGYIYWHVQARCYSSWTTSSWSSTKSLNEPATSS